MAAQRSPAYLHQMPLVDAIAADNAFAWGVDGWREAVVKAGVANYCFPMFPAGSGRA